MGTRKKEDKIHHAGPSDQFCPISPQLIVERSDGLAPIHHAGPVGSSRMRTPPTSLPSEAFANRPAPNHQYAEGTGRHLELECIPSQKPSVTALGLSAPANQHHAESVGFSTCPDFPPNAPTSESHRSAPFLKAIRKLFSFQTMYERGFVKGHKGTTTIWIKKGEE